jgi:hypothetical protein
MGALVAHGRIISRILGLLLPALWQAVVSGNIFFKA